MVIMGFDFKSLEAKIVYSGSSLTKTKSKTVGTPF